jgi:hypothetical protein
MASEIKVDTIVNAGGDNDTGIDLATNDQILLKVANATKLTMNSTGQTTIVGEGGTTTTSVQQGLVKCWCNFKGDGTAAIRDSLNFSSISDQGTGQYDLAITNSMANNDYYYGSLQRTNSVTQGVAGESDLETGRVHDHKAFSSESTAVDRDLQGGLIAGDLA